MIKIVWNLMALLIVLLIIETLSDIIRNFKLEREFKRSSKEYDKAIKKLLEERKKGKEEEVEVL